MGLDMYLTRELYIGAKYEHRQVAGEIAITIKGEPLPISLQQIATITCEMGYWRKANAIHDWIVRNVQDGVDECQKAYFPREKMQELLDTVNKVLEASELVPGTVTNGYSFAPAAEGYKYNAGEPLKSRMIPILEEGKLIKDATVAAELLPPAEGCFFGSQEYNEWYVNDLQDTKRILEECLQEKYNGDDFYYQSSW
jgi:hypothetical protein